jgi:hypothetical protein
MPVTAGVLMIITSAAHLFVGLVLGVILSVFTFIGGFFAIPMEAAGVLALIGGIFAIQRRYFGMALTGAIVALLPPFTVLGVLAIIFVAIAKPEFK